MTASPYYAGLNAHVDGEALTRRVIEAATRLLRECFERQHSAPAAAPAAPAAAPAAAQNAGTDTGAVSECITDRSREALARLPAQPPPPPPPPQPRPPPAPQPAPQPSTRLEVELVALDSHTPSKFSRHLLLRPVKVRWLASTPGQLAAPVS